MRLDPMLQQSAPKKHTLRIALLVSAVIHGAVLFWVKFDASDPAPEVEVPRLEVSLVLDEPEPELPPEPEPENEPEPEPEIEVAERVAPQPTAVPAVQDSPSPEPPTAPDEASEPVDLQALISTTAEDIATENLENERHRAEMWHKTFSVMFAPPDEWLIADEPYLPDLVFEADKPKRLGIKISENCYLGFPGIDPQSVDSDAPGWSGGGTTQPSIDLISCGFGD